MIVEGVNTGLEPFKKKRLLAKLEGNDLFSVQVSINHDCEPSKEVKFKEIFHD